MTCGDASERAHLFLFPEFSTMNQPAMKRTRMIRSEPSAPSHGRVHGMHAPNCILAAGHDGLGTLVTAGPMRIASSQALTTSRWRLDSGDSTDLFS